MPPIVLYDCNPTCFFPAGFLGIYITSFISLSYLFGAFTFNVYVKNVMVDQSNDKAV